MACIIDTLILGTLSLNDAVSNTFASVLVV